jgi:hypothetical protein
MSEACYEPEMTKEDIALVLERAALGLKKRS